MCFAIFSRIVIVLQVEYNFYLNQIKSHTWQSITIRPEKFSMFIKNVLEKNFYVIITLVVINFRVY